MTTFSTFATATYASGNVVVVQSAENMIPGLPITFAGNTFGNVTANATYYIGNITFGFPTSNITLTSLPGGAIYAVGNGSGSMVASFTQGGQQIIPTVPPGEPLNQAFNAINVNFDQIFAAGPVGSNIQIDENTIYTLNTNGNLVLNPNGIGNVIANAHVIPDRDRVRNLGAPALRWNTIYAQNIVGNIAGNVVAGGSNGQIQFNDNGILAGANGFTFLANTSSVSVVGSITAGNVLTPGIVSSAGGIYGDIYTTLIDSGDSSAILIISEVNMLSDLTVGQSLQVDNNILANGNITGDNLFFGAGVVSGTGNIYANKIFANIQGNVDAAGNLYEVQFNTTGDQLGASSNFTYNFANNVLTVNGGNVVGGNVIGGNIFSTGLVSATGNISANYYFGNGSQLTGITADNVNADDLVGNILSGNVLYSNLITVGNLVSLSVVGNTNTGNLSTAGNVSATYFFGNGSQLTGIDATSIQNGNSNVRVAANANVTVGVSGISNVAVFTPTGVDITGTMSATGNITASYYFGNGSQLTGVAASSVNANNLIGNTLSSNVIFSSLTTVGNLVDLSVVGTTTTGNLSTAGSVSAAGNIISNANITGGNLLTSGTVSAGSNVIGGNVLTGGIVSATSTIQGGNIVTAGDVTATGSVTGGNVFTGGVVSAVSTITGGNLATAGTVTATGTVTGGNVVTGGIVSATGNITGGNLSTAGNVSGANVIATNGFFGNINLTGNITANSLTSNTFISATGTGTFGNIATAGTVSATGNVTGNYFIGNGALLTGIDTTLISNGNTNVQTYANGNVSVTVAGVANTVVFTTTGVGIAGTVSASGNVTGGNLLTGGAVSAVGNVTGANVNTTTVWSNSDLNLQPVGNVALGNRYVTGVRYPSADQDAASKIYVDNMVSTGLAYHQAVTAATTTDLATATGGTITYTQPNGASNGVGAYIATTGSFNLIDTANVQTANTRILVKDEGNAVLNGVYYWANSSTIVRTTDADEYGPNSSEQLSINDYFFVQSGNVNKGSAWVVDSPTGNITFGTSNIQFAEFSSSQTYTANTNAGLTLTGTVFSAKVDNNTTAFDGGGNIIVKAGANLTTPNIGAATGTSLSVTGNVQGGNIVTVGYVTATGNVTGGNIVTAGNITATGNVTGNYFIGNGSQLTGVTAASMDAGNLTGNTLSSNVVFSSLTTVGTLTSLSVSGNVGGGNIHTAGVVSATGTVTGGNIATGGSVTATGAVTAGNVLTGGAVSATGTGTFGNIVTGGTISATSTIQGGNILTAGEVSAGGSVTGGNIYTGGVVSAVSTVTGGNLATTGTVTATGTVTGGNILTGGVVSATGTGTFGNVGTTGYVSATGNIVSANTVSGANITTAGVVSAAGNVTGGNILFGSGIVSGTGNIYANKIFANISGNIDAAGNVNEIQFNTTGDQLGANANFTYDAANNVFTVNSGNVVGGNILSGGLVSASSNIIGGNILTGGLISATGNITGNNVVVGNILIPSSGNVTLGNVNINNLANPVANSDAATKFYVDSVAANVLPIITNQTITPNGSANTFVLDQSTTAVGILLTINGITQTPTTNYTVTGNSLTIGETPLSSDIIQVRYLSGTTTGGGGGGNSISNGTSNVAIATANGNVVVGFAGSDTFTFGTDGNLTFLHGSKIAEVVSPVPGNYALALQGSGSNPDQQLLIYPTFVDANHLHLTSGNLYNTELFLGNDDLYIKLANTGNVLINSNDNAGNTAQWTFGADGTTTFPTGGLISNYPGITGANNSWFVTPGNGTGGISSQDGQQYIQVNNDLFVEIGAGYGTANSFVWQFGLDGSFATPGNISTNGNVIAGNILVVGSISPSSVTASPAPSLSGFSSVSAITLSASGNVTVGGNLSVTGNIIGNVVTTFESTWTVPTGNSTQSFTVGAGGTYYLWVDCNIPNGILAWNATGTVTNTNVPVVGAQYAWVYNGGGTPIDFTSIPNQFTGTANTIVRSSVAPSATTNRFDFGIRNTSGGNVTVRYGWARIS